METKKAVNTVVFHSATENTLIYFAQCRPKQHISSHESFHEIVQVMARYRGASLGQGAASCQG